MGTTSVTSPIKLGDIIEWNGVYGKEYLLVLSGKWPHFRVQLLPDGTNESETIGSWTFNAEPYKCWKVVA